MFFFLFFYQALLHVPRLDGNVALLEADQRADLRGRRLASLDDVRRALQMGRTKKKKEEEDKRIHLIFSARLSLSLFPPPPKKK